LGGHAINGGKAVNFIKSVNACVKIGLLCQFNCPNVTICFDFIKHSLFQTSMDMEKIKVLFVCMGNICRSPTAEGVFTKLIKEQGVDAYFAVDSAGTHAHHVGDAPDLRAQKAALDRGIELMSLRARKVVMGDFEDFDFLLAMDDDNYSILIDACPEQHKDKIKYFLDYAPHLNEREVPDPYYGGKYGFEKVLDMIEEASAGFLKTLQETGTIKWP
jgi:protein-tyrosine phosphatase